MDEHDRFSTADLLTLLAIPAEGRMVTFGSAGAAHALKIAAERPDVLIVVCATDPETITKISAYTLAAKIDNLVVGDTPAGPLVDRALCVDFLAAIEPQHLVMLRTAMLPGGYAIFAESEKPAAAPLAEKLRTLGYAVADALDGALPQATVIRAR